MMTSGRGKRTSILLNEKQMAFLKELARRIEKKCRKRIPHSEILTVLTKILTYIKPDIGECKTEEEIEKELLKRLKKGS